MCETCYFHLVEYLGNTTKKESQQQKQQLNNKNKSRENKYIFESKELINVNTQKSKKRSAALPAPRGGEHNTKETLKTNLFSRFYT